MKVEHIPNKHLTYEERDFIEIGLNKERSFSQIAEDINKNRRTISREIQRHRFRKNPSGFNNSKNICKNRYECKKFDCSKKKECYEEEICFRLTGTPYVCNGCEQKNRCRKIKYYYYAKFANDEYSEKLKTSRYGINQSKEEIYELDKIIAPLIVEKHQSISHIYANHPDEIKFSRSTMYNYVDLGVFSFKNIDLPRKVKYKKRKENKKQRIRRETAIRKGRTYEDFKEYIGKNPECSIVEMDTVEGKKGGKVFLTLLIRQSKFMLIYLMEHKTKECVEEAFKEIKEMLGKEIFKRIFEVILTDNGSEFFNPMSIEKDEETEEIISHVFYCDPEASWQKGAIEKNHEYIRYVLPKGSSFNELTQDKTNILMSNINSTSRDSLNGKTPYNATLLILDEEVIEKLGVIRIEADEVSLSPKLLKVGDK
ncbi:MAG: IS30 family transposase [Bacilli bacterium]|nr:IS30 family transposase [Bacilli bacterium]